MVDLINELHDYNIIDLKDIAQNNSDIPDNIRNSILLYNKAIDSLHTGNEDIAIIELKKAVSMNPHFYEAMNLLGICYTHINDTAKAAEIFNKVIKAEKNSVKALEYMNILNSSDSFYVKPKTKKKSAEALTVNKPVNKNKENDSKALLKDYKKIMQPNIVRYIACFAAGALIVTLIFLAASWPGNNANVPVIKDNTGVDSTLGDNNVKYNELLSKYDLLQRDKETAIKNADYYKSIIKLYEVDNLVSMKQYENAADVLLLIKTVNFKDEYKEKYESLYKKVMPDACWILYEAGYKLYNKGDYQDCLKKMDKIQVYDNTFSRLDAVYYYMGRSYQQLNDSRNAIALYQKLIDSYPDSSYIKSAKVKIRVLTENP